ncbi:TonB-dependent receptor [Shewanella sp. 202IG2-18]|uniref:TonB-dependent receptor n=1 Tax=Parashewanella hymeniacidonis TaxID=2807618 RepID=UPI00196158B9|nr:TonB-dependent receptor [Parashewanella hymeniacidonis]MBM7071061.1 TonB-dependent receptor [Parashewanella hymeniacidonis]
MLRTTFLKNISNDQTKKNTSLNLVTKAILASMLASPLSVLAEEDNKDNEIEVLTVTAQKRSQSILDVPVTVSAVSEKTIDDAKAIGLSGIDKFIPGFKFYDANATQSVVEIRGISSPNISVGGDPSSAIFYDDVYMPSAAQNVIFSDTARVEVLKGPQGTLFGRNAAMGVVNIVPNSPSAEFESFLQGSWGTDNLQRYEGMVNVPISDNVYMRANWITNKQDGFVENVQDAEWNQSQKVWDLGARNHDAARIAFLWDISESTDFQFSFDWDDLDQAPPVAVGLSEFAYGGGKDPFASKAANDVFNGKESRDMYGLIAKLNHDFNDEWSMKYIVSYRDWDTNNIEDSDGTGDRTRYFDTNTAYDSDIFYTELQVNYTSDRVNLVTGFSFSKENVKQRTDLNLTADTAARLTTGELNNVIQGMMAQQLAAQLGGNTDAHAAAAFGEGATFSGAVQQIYSDSGFPLDHIWNPAEWAGALTALGFADDIMTAIGMPGQPLTAEIVQFSGDITYDAVSQALGIAEVFGPSHTGSWWQESVHNQGSFTNWGVFADVDFSITDNWNVIAGLRYSNDDKDFSWFIPETSFAAIRPGVSNIIFPVVDLKASDSWDKVTGRLVTSYHFSNTDMIFASYSTGYKSGGFDSLSPRVEAFQPEDTTNYEIGYKGILFDKLVANISGYYLELDNFQQTVESRAPGANQAVPIIVNEDRTIKGIELELRWNVTDNLTLGAVSEYRKTEINSPEFYNAKSELISAQTTNLDPQTNYTLTLDWMPDFGMGHTNLHVDYAFVENTNMDIPGLEDYKKAVPEFFRDTKNLSARLSWAIEDESLELGLWGKNITDERRVLDVVGLTAGVLGTPFAKINRGAEFGFDVKFSF